MTRQPTDAEHHFLHELDKQLAADDNATVTAVTVGEAIDQDARETVEVLAGLFGLRLAKIAGANDDDFCDEYTLKPLDLTWRGTVFLRNAPALFD